MSMVSNRSTIPEPHADRRSPGAVGRSPRAGVGPGGGPGALPGDHRRRRGRARRRSGELGGRGDHSPVRPDPGGPRRRRHERRAALDADAGERARRRRGDGVVRGARPAACRRRTLWRRVACGSPAQARVRHPHRAGRDGCRHNRAGAGSRRGPDDTRLGARRGSPQPGPRDSLPAFSSTSARPTRPCSPSWASCWRARLCSPASCRRGGRRRPTRSRRCGPTRVRAPRGRSASAVDRVPAA